MSEELQNPYAPTAATMGEKPWGVLVPTVFKNPTVLGWIAIISNLLMLLTYVMLQSMDFMGLLDMEDESEELGFFLLFVSILGLGLCVFLLIFLITFLMWTYRCAKNAHQFDRGDHRYSPGWCVGSYFIPIYNLWGPYLGLREIVRITFQHAEGRNVAKFLLPWWLCFLAGNFLGLIDDNHFVDGISLACELATAVFLFLIIRGISKAQVEVMLRGVVAGD